MAEGAVRKRTIEICGTLRMEDVGADKRIRALEEKVMSLQSVDKNAFGQWVLEVVKAVLPGVVIAIVGFALNNTVDHALKERELQIDAIKSMQVLSADLQKPTITKDEAQAKAAELAAYGKYSVPFFINVHEIGNEYGALGAEEGLRMVARSEPGPVCAQTIAVIRNRTGLYHLQTHLAALSLIGEVRCGAALVDVTAYQSDLNSLATLQTWVATPPPDQKEYEKIGGEVQEALTRLRRRLPPPQLNQ